MSSFSRQWAALGPIALASIVGCSSSSSPGSPDSGQDAVGGTDAAGADADAAAQTCGASVLPPLDAGGACNTCIETSCMTELAACASDCVCGPIEACLELTNLNNYPGCPGALAAISSGQVPLMNIAGCAAAKCQGPCFSGGAGGD